jgi:hypothetical protein
VSENVMAFSSLLGATTEGIGAFKGADALRLQGKFANEQAEFEARMAELQAQDAERRGAQAAQGVQSKARRIIGSQRAALAAQGVDVSSGSAVDVQADTAYQASLDAEQIKGNAWREAFGIRTNAQQGLFRGKMTQLAAENQAAATVLTGSLRMAGGALQSYRDWSSGQKTEPKPDKASWWERKAWEALGSD